MGKNKTGKYLKYAIGEIALVVIGILIALQLNNWNEGQKIEKEEIKILKEFKNSISTDIQQLNALYMQGKKDIESSDILIDWLDNKIVYSDTLNRHFTIITRAGKSKFFNPQISAYKVLESKGVDLISNTDLKKQILDLYNIDYPKMNFEYQNYRQNVLDYGRPIARTSFKIKGDLGTKGDISHIKLAPIDYKELLSNTEFYNTIKVLQLNGESINGSIIEVLKLCQKIETTIEKEIEK